MKYIYFSGQQTVRIANLITNILNNDTILYTSSPNFNKAKSKESIEAWSNINKIEINESCYGNIVEMAAEYASDYGYEVEMCVSNFVLEKAIKHSIQLLDVLSKLGYITAFNNLTIFINGLNKIINGDIIINSKDEWNTFLINHNLSPTLELNLDLYLLNFDNTLTKENIEEIYSSSDELKNNTRWLTKLNFTAKGCYTDVLNLIKVLEINNQQLPTYFIMDGENDDIACLQILTRLNNNIIVYLQLPSEFENIDILEKIKGKIANNKCKYIFDPESANTKVLKDFYNIV
jgi:hypothetical protein